MPGVRMAKANEKDFEKTRKFLQRCESIWDNRDRYSFRCLEDEWEEWDDGDEDKIELIEIRKELSIEEKCSEEEVDNRIIIYEFIKRSYKRCDAHWGRIVMAADALIEAFCDPQETHLASSPYLEVFHVANEQ